MTRPGSIEADIGSSTGKQSGGPATTAGTHTKQGDTWLRRRWRGLVRPLRDWRAGLRSVRSPRRRSALFVTGVLAALTAVTGGVLLSINQAGAATCTSNDIIKCGYSDKKNFIDKVKANDNGVNSVADLQAIYAHYGLSQSDYQNFQDNAQPGEAHSNGDVTLNNGTVVATGGESIGRDKSAQGSNPFTVSIAGHDYYGNVNAQAFADGVKQLPVDILFDAQGNMQFAVMPSCGNPEFGKPKKSSASCDVLNVTPASGKPNTFNFTASASATGFNKIVRFVYDFGDGTPQVSQTSGSTVVSHIYAKPGTFKATVTVFATIVTGQTVQLPAVSTCAKQVTVKPAPVSVACAELTGTPVDDNKLSFTLTAVAAVSTGGPKLTSADFDFGDGNTQAGVKPNADGLSATIQHTYASGGPFTASAVLHFTDTTGTGVTAPACTFKVSPTAPPPTPTPPTPPAPPVTPPVLPNTGAGNVIALFGAAGLVGFLGYHLVLLRRHRATR